MRILYVTTISLTMNAFFKPHVEMLVNEGNIVDIACNCNGLELDSFYQELGCEEFQIDFSRSPLSGKNINAYKQLKHVVENGNYDIVHCHTPNASVITRLVCRKLRKKNGLKVFYTAHGFHFYKGAPKLNWLVYYPIEKYCSRFTDKLITINGEDYERAKKKFKAKEIHYVPGVGIDVKKFENIKVDRYAKRREIGVPEDAFLLFSVGELNENKNHQIIIKAMAELNNANVHYAIAGDGVKKEYLLDLANRLGISDRVHLLGYRTDIAELDHVADVFCFPSLREGLGLAAVEAMACGVPVVAADNRGTRSFMADGQNGYVCKSDDTFGFVNVLCKLVADPALKNEMSDIGRIRAKDYLIENVLERMKGVYQTPC